MRSTSTARWDEGIPEEIGHDHLYGLAWNPMTLIEVLKNIDGAATARRVGTDSLSPTFAQLLPMAFPNAELVDARGRRCGLPAADQDADEIARAAGALRVAERGAGRRGGGTGAGSHRAGADRRMLEAMAAGGVTHVCDAGRRVDNTAANTRGGGGATEGRKGR